MKKRLKQLTSLGLSMGMVLSMVGSTTWANVTVYADDEAVTAETSEDGESQTSTDDSESDAWQPSSEFDMTGGGGGAPSDSAPSVAGIYIKDNAEDTSAEYAKSDDTTLKIKNKTLSEEEDGIVTIKDLKITSENYETNGLVVGENSDVLLDNAKIVLDTGNTISGEETGGDAVIVGDGSTLRLDGSTIIVKGAQRHVTAAFDDSVLIVNDSTIKSTGSVGDEDANATEPRSNAALLIYGMSRANFSIGATDTYYYNSECVSEGWGALSTDSATGDGLDLYAYNTYALSKNGGYGAYADTNCRLWFYGSTIASGEIGVIISKTGELTADNGAGAGADALKYLDADGDTTDDETVIAGLRNAIMMHAPDMMGQGAAAASTATVNLSNTLLTTDANSEYLEDANNAEDYTEKYGEAIGAYVDYVTGADILLRSTSAKITLDNVGIETGASDNAIIKTVINSDSMSNWLLASDEDVDSIDVSMTNMDVEGNIVHMDYQRTMNVSLGEEVEYEGAIIGGTYESWNALWEDYGEDACWVLDADKYMTTTHGVNVTLTDDACWELSEDSNLESLTVEDDAVVVIPSGITLTVGDDTYTAGKITADGFVSNEVLTVVSGSNGPLLADDTEVASITLKNTGDEDAEITVVNLGEERTEVIAAGDELTIAAPALFDNSEEAQQTVNTGSEDSTETNGSAYKLALTVNGVETAINEGTTLNPEEDDIVVSIVYGVLDYYVSHGQSTARWITCAIYADENGVDATRSVLAAVQTKYDLNIVEAGDTCARNITIKSQNADFAAIRTGGSGTFKVYNADIDLIGNGGDDFTGIGAALGAADTSTLIVNHADIYTSGVLRAALFAGDAGSIVLNSSTADCEPGIYQSSVSIASAGMSSPPSGLGIWGNCRLMNMVDYASVEITKSNLTSQNWGALGVDDVSDGSLNVSDSKITITEQGYGSYAIGKCVDVFDNCEFDIAYGVVNYAAAGSGAEVVLENGTLGNSLGYYGIVTHQSFNGTNSKITVTGEGTELNGKYGGIIAKGRGTDIEISDGATVSATEGPIVRAQINDDTGAGSMDGTEVVNVSVSDTALEGDIIQGMGDSSSDTKTSTMNVDLNNASLTGAISSAFLTLKISDGKISFANITDVGIVTDTELGHNTAANLNVTLENNAVWTLTETSYLMSLTIDETSAIVADDADVYMTVDGKETEIEAGKTYEGAIVLSIGSAEEVEEESVEVPQEAASETQSTTTSEAATETQNAATSETTTTTGETTTITKGSKVTVNNVSYVVTDVSKKTVKVTEATPKKGKVTIPETISISNQTYKVTAIANGVFKGNKKLTKIVIGANVTTIGKNAFKNAKNLKTIVIQNGKTLTSVGNNAFKGINKNATIKINAATKKAYKKARKLILAAGAKTATFAFKKS